ncbi:unnamed protein product [Musa acuminata subsp. burmannicoides]
MEAVMRAERPMLTSGASGRVAALLSVRVLRGLLLLLQAAALLLLLPFRWRPLLVSTAERSAPAPADGRPEASRKGGHGGVVVRVPAAMVPRRQREHDASWRRALAVRRVVEAMKEGQLGRDFSLFTTARGDTLFTQSWTPVNLKTRGLVVLLHGLNEHSGRYNDFAEKLNENGFKVYAMDWMGHGGSDGLHGYVHSLDYAVSDLEAFLEKVLAENPGTPCFCFGHSTGAAIILKAACDPKVEGWIKGLVLTSPAVLVQPSHPIVMVLAPMFCLLAPKYQFSAANNSGSVVSRDPEALQSKYSDPLVFTGSIRVRTGCEILRMSTYLLQNLNKIKIPFLVLHGASDTVTDPEGSQRLFDEASSTDKSIKLYHNLLHDLLIEPEREKIMQDIIDWLSFRLSAGLSCGPLYPPSITLLIYIPPFDALKQILPSLPRSSAAIMPEKEQQVEVSTCFLLLCECFLQELTKILIFVQVLWPRLVANKLLRRPVGNNSFVADLPCSDVLLELANLDEFDPKRPRKYLKDTRKYKLYVGTWNVGGILPSDDVNLEDWLDINNDYYDIYVLGFQEIVPLSAKNVLGAEKRRILAQWNSLVRTTLNKSSSNLEGRKEPKVGERHKACPAKEGFARDFRCIISKQMVGVLVSVWARHELQYYIRHPSVSCVGCGVMGCLGNKGSVSVRFCLHETSFCFVCCHLASGGRKGDEMNRNSDAVDVLSRTSFPRGPSLDLPHKILDHDRVILLGDLNYRISLPEAITRSLVEQKQWDILLERDQLRTEVSKGRVFEDWQEGAITFSPTYKYYPNSDKYYGCIQGQKGEKRRAPAWCDRILWHGDGLKQKRYDRCESWLSDHRPVRAVFTASVDVRRSFNSLGSFFLSERFDRPDDEHANGGGGRRRSINAYFVPRTAYLQSKAKLHWHAQNTNTVHATDMLKQYRLWEDIDMDMDVTFMGKHVRMLRHISISREGWIVKAPTSLVNLLRSSKIHLCPPFVFPLFLTRQGTLDSRSLSLSLLSLIHSERERGSGSSLSPAEVTFCVFLASLLCKTVFSLAFGQIVEPPFSSNLLSSAYMDDDGGLGIRNWGFYEPPMKGNLGLRLMPSVMERDAKPLLSSGGFMRRQCGIPEPSVPPNFVRDGWRHHGNDSSKNDLLRDGWIHHNSDNDKNFHIFPVNHQHHPGYGVIPDPPTGHNLQMLQHPEPQPKHDKVLTMEANGAKDESPLKKRSRGRPQKSPKPKKPKKAVAPSDDVLNGSLSHEKGGRKSTGMVINGIDFDISRIPTPVCSCTGKPQQCYRWGIGGWQSACCTTSISMHPLPMSTKRRGARIAGRKMSQGAFKKVLEKLAGEGYNLSNPIDLRTFWAKHGTNKYVTIR